MPRYRTQIEKVANRESLELLRRANVISVQEGPKIKNGVRTGETCLVIGVKAKQSASKLLSHDLIPKEYHGLKTDVIEVAEVFPESRTGKMRPVQGGISICDADYAAGCSLGAVVKCSLTGRLAILTNNHCAGMLYDTDHSTPDRAYAHDFVNGRRMIQPSSVDGGSVHNDRIGIVLRAVPVKFGLSGDNQCDAAICSIDELDGGWYSMFESYEGPFLFADMADLYQGLSVWKSGRTTGVTSGLIDTVSLSLNVQYGTTNNDRVAMTDIIKAIPSSHAIFSSGGDSGSCWTAEIGGVEHVIGLHFAGDGTNGFACQIEHVADQLYLEPWDGTVYLARSATSSILVNGKNYSRVGNSVKIKTHTEDL